MNPCNDSVKRQYFYMIPVTLKPMVYLPIYSEMSTSNVLSTGGDATVKCSDSSCLVIVDSISIAFFQRDTMDSGTIIYTWMQITYTC